jgi:hypothetical protein
MGRICIGLLLVCGGLAILLHAFLGVKIYPLVTAAFAILLIITGIAYWWKGE